MSERPDTPGISTGGSENGWAAELRSRPVAGLCGIGNPEGFRRTLEGLGYRLVDFRVYPDHHGYTRQDVEQLRAWARSLPDEARSARQKPASEVRAETRSRIRVLCKSYSTLALVWVLPTAFILGLVESLGLLVTGRFARARAVLGGWFSAFRHPGELRRARKATQKLRRVEDGDVRDLMIRGS